MGVEVETLFPAATEELLQVRSAVDYDQRTTTWLVEDHHQQPQPKSLNGGLRRKRPMPTALMRKSHSDKPLAAPLTGLHCQSSASLQSDDNQHEDSSPEPISATRRQVIMTRAEEIMQGKRQVGLQYGEECPVCLADDVDTQLTPCGHRVHAKCIKRWIQSGTQCPVCRETLTGIEEAYSGPPSALCHPLEKDLAELSLEEASTTSTDPQSFEWGWFEDFDDFDQDQEDGIYGTRCSDPLEHMGGRLSSPLLNRAMSTTFEVCRTFSPLRLEYDAPYSASKHEFLRCLPSHRHIAAKIQIRSFRIVETAGSKAQHAEYLIELQLDGRYVSQWRRYSDLSKFVGSLRSTEFRRALAVWSELETESRWFNRLEVSYLHRRCRLLEQFAHAFLLECATAHPLAELLEG